MVAELGALLVDLPSVRRLAVVTIARDQLPVRWNEKRLVRSFVVVSRIMSNITIVPTGTSGHHQSSFVPSALLDRTSIT